MCGYLIVGVASICSLIGEEENESAENNNLMYNFVSVEELEK